MHRNKSEMVRDWHTGGQEKVINKKETREAITTARH
jgi:hypothetical protein